MHGETYKSKALQNDKVIDNHKAEWEKHPMGIGQTLYSVNTYKHMIGQTKHLQTHDWSD